MAEQIALKSIDNYPLKEPIILDVQFDKNDKLWILQNEELGIVGVGKTKEEALDSAKENFIATIEIYLAEDDNNLTPEAIELKNRIADILWLNEDTDSKI